MGACAAKEEDVEVTQLRQKAQQFGIAMPDGAATLNDSNIDAVRAEVERYEKMPPMSITCCLPDDDGEETEINVRAWEQIGDSMQREVVGFFAIGVFGARVSFGNMDQELSQRWEDLGVEEGATVSAFLGKVRRGPHLKNDANPLGVWLGG